MSGRRERAHREEIMGEGETDKLGNKWRGGA